MPELNPVARLGMALLIALLVGTIVAYHAFLERHLERNRRKKAPEPPATGDDAVIWRRR